MLDFQNLCSLQSWMPWDLQSAQRDSSEWYMQWYWKRAT